MNPLPTLENPISQAVTQSQLEEPYFETWCREMGRIPAMNRKLWEWAYILRVLEVHDMLNYQSDGLGFGVGQEPITAVLAAYEVNVFATDHPQGKAAWDWSHQWAGAKDHIPNDGICDEEQFDRVVKFEFMDMRHIPTERYGEEFSFCWSASSLDHLGTRQAGIEFILNSLDILTPGGLAVHTTEFNVTQGRTLDNGEVIAYSRDDLLSLQEVVTGLGHSMEINLRLGEQYFDKEISKPPHNDLHLRLQFGDVVLTSVGLVIRKKL